MYRCLDRSCRATETLGVELLVTVEHASGEIAAAFEEGLVSASEAIVVAYYHGNTVRGFDIRSVMLAIGLGAGDTQPYIEEQIGKAVVACHSSLPSVTLSDDWNVIYDVEFKLIEKDISARPIETDGKAYHSHRMRSISFKYRDMMLRAKRHITVQPSHFLSVVMISSMTNAKSAPEAVIDHEYWS